MRKIIRGKRTDKTRKNGKSRRKLTSLVDEGLAVSIISLAELYEGIYAAENSEKQMEGLDDFTTRIVVLEIGGETAKIFGKQRAALRKEGKLIDNFDLLIAATCLCYDLTLLTNNISHFDRVKGLKIGVKVE